MTSLDRTDVGLWLCWAAVPMAIFPMVLPAILLPIARRCGFELVEEEGWDVVGHAVYFRGKPVTSATPSRTVRFIADFVGPLGVMKYFTMITAPVGVVMGAIGMALRWW